MSEPLETYWTEEDCADVEKATEFGELSVVACRIAARMPPPVGIVCGPITSGGLGSTEANLAHFWCAIEYLRCRRLVVFNQLPFENALFEIKHSKRGDSGAQLLNEFYLPLFRTRLIHVMYFMPGWQGSVGASWERERGRELRIAILDLPDTWWR